MSDGTEPTIVVVTPGAEDAGEGGAVGEVEGDSSAEAVADAAVEIAQIEADRDVTLAVIHTEADVERAEAYSNEELQQCRTRIAELEAENALLKTPPVLLIPEPLLEPPPSPEVVEVVEPESGAEDGPKESPAPEEKAPEPPPRKPKPHRWI